MQRGDIYLVSLDPSAGHEQQGTRPVLIVSPEAFNKMTQLPVVLPMLCAFFVLVYNAQIRANAENAKSRRMGMWGIYP